MLHSIEKSQFYIWLGIGITDICLEGLLYILFQHFFFAFHTLWSLTYLLSMNSGKLLTRYSSVVNGLLVRLYMVFPAWVSICGSLGPTAPSSHTNLSSHVHTGGWSGGGLEVSPGLCFMSHLHSSLYRNKKSQFLVVKVVNLYPFMATYSLKKVRCNHSQVCTFNWTPGFIGALLSLYLCTSINIKAKYTVGMA